MTRGAWVRLGVFRDPGRACSQRKALAKQLLEQSRVLIMEGILTVLLFYFGMLSMDSRTLPEVRKCCASEPLHTLTAHILRNECILRSREAFVAPVLRSLYSRAMCHHYLILWSLARIRGAVPYEYLAFGA